MKGDFTRFTFDRRKHYSSIRMQQGRVQLDSDWNELVDIQSYRIRIESEDFIGPSGAPKLASGFSVKVTTDGKDLSISPGRMYVDGILCENETEVLLTTQPDLPGYALPTGDGLYLVYLDVWERHITALEDPAIREVALGGPDTTTRVRVVWQAKLLSIPDPDAMAGGLDELAQWNELRATPTGRLLARRKSGVASENRLYRVEIHDAGDLESATFKWSSKNGSPVARLESIAADNQIIIGDAGRAGQPAFSPGQWIELSDEARALGEKPGVFVELEDVEGNVLTVRPLPDDSPLTQVDLATNATVRAWTSGGALALSESADPDGFVTLDDGLQVKFEAGSYRSGDYWLIPTRSGTEEIEWTRDGSDPLPKPPYGLNHRCCALALVERRQEPEGTITLEVKEDLRAVFSPLTHHAGGAGVSRQITQPDHGFSLGQAIYYDAQTGAYRLARSDDETTTGMFLVSVVRSASQFTLLQAGYIGGLAGLTPGEYYFVSADTPGALVLEEPVRGVSNPILFADSDTGGYVLPYRPSETAARDVQALFDLMRPVGDTFVQWYGAENPNVLFNRGGIRSEWIDTDITPGAFFRARGGNANVTTDDELTGETQLHQMESHTHTEQGEGHQHPPAPGADVIWFGYDNEVHGTVRMLHGDAGVIFLATHPKTGPVRVTLGDPVATVEGKPRPLHGEETRPQNVAIICWRRIA